MDARTKIDGCSARFRAAGLSALAFVALAANAGASQGPILLEGRVGPFYTRSVLWGAADLTESNIREYYKSQSEKLKGWRAWTIRIFTDEGDCMRENGAGKTVEVDYPEWLGQYNLYGRHLLPMAEIVVSGESAVARLRDSAGDCSEFVLAGGNFLHADIEGIGFEILRVVYHPLPPYLESTPGDEAEVSVFVRTSRPTDAESARRFTRGMQERFQEKRVTASFRNNSYFLTASRFPILYRFDPAPAPPGWREYVESWRMSCFGEMPGIQCN